MDKHNYCSFELKGGKRIEGWIVKEDKDAFFLSMSRPILKLNPLKLNYNSYLQPIKIPKIMIQSLAKSKQ